MMRFHRISSYSAKMAYEIRGYATTVAIVTDTKAGGFLRSRVR
jgi:hypothetical protein